MNAYLNLSAVELLMPEIVVAGAATLILVLAAFWRGTAVWVWLAGASLAVAAWLLGLQSPLAAATGPLAADALAMFMRWLTLLMGLLLLMVMARAGDGRQVGENIAMLLFIISGGMLVAGSDELVLMFLGLELVSIPTYVMLYLGRQNAASQEAASKYFFLSILSSAVLLYGLSFLYGISGHTQLSQIAVALSSAATDTASWQTLGGLALVLIFAGLGFRITAVPFHFYAPDVYQGTTNGNAALLSVIPKVVGFAALIRIAILAMPTLESYGWRLALILSLLTMTVGNMLALWQDNLRRLFAYSSIANAGYMLIGIAAAFANVHVGEAGPLSGVGATIFFLVIYSVGTIGVFATLAWLGGRERQVEHMDDLAGVGSTHPLAGMMLAVFMFSLAGIPPLAGFWGKFAVFFSALGVDTDSAALGGSVRSWFLLLAVVGVLNAAIAAAYYLRVVAVMYFRSPLAAPKAEGGPAAFTAALISAVAVVLLGIAGNPLLQRAEQTMAPRVSDTAAAAEVETPTRARLTTVIGD